MRLSLLCVTVIWMCIAAALAQQPDKTAASLPPKKSGEQSSKSHAPGTSLAQPGPEMQRLVNALSGTWSIALKFETSERTSKGRVGQGKEVWRPGPGGFSFIEDYHSTGDEGERSGFGVLWWDENVQRYQVVWCDGSNPGGCTLMWCNWDGAQLVVMHEWEEAGKKFAFKEVFSDIAPTSFTQTIYTRESGGELKQSVTIRATRLTKAKPRTAAFDSKQP